ncbi:MAG: PadR family transcriptional regulator [Planctomycetota bacterium]
MPRLPPYTPLQFAVLSLVVPGEVPGRALRQALKDKYGHKRSGPAFYQLMSRLEEMGLVVGTYHTVTVGEQDVRERRYSLTGDGVDALNEMQAFHTLPDVSGYAAGEA